MMEYGLKNETLQAIQFVFRRYHQIESAVLYGSRANGNFRPNSDIDITLKGSTIDLTTLFKIENELDDLMLPYKIDLSVYHNIDNQDLIDHISRVGVEFYSKSH